MVNLREKEKRDGLDVGTEGPSGLLNGFIYLSGS